jgi:AcrR family transcriptional regulator
VAANTRQRMVFSAMQLFREHGYNGTGFRQVIAHSGAPRGSIYHHFPEGKAQMGVEAVHAGGDFVATALEAALQARGPDEGFESFLSWWIEFLEERHFQAGCPVLAVAAESHVEAPELAAAAAAVFERWETIVAGALESAGVDHETAWDLSLLVVSAVEGAMVLCRATQDRGPLVRVGGQLSQALHTAIARA